MKDKRTKNIKAGVSPTKERRRQNGGVICEAIAAENGKSLINRYRAACECPLDVLKNFRVIEEPEYRAGLRFMEAYYNAVLSPHAAYERLNDYPFFTELTMSEKLLKEAHSELSTEELQAVVASCGFGHMTWTPVTREKLHKALGHLSIAWHTNAIEVCERKTNK